MKDQQKSPDDDRMIGGRAQMMCNRLAGESKWCGEGQQEGLDDNGKVGGRAQMVFSDTRVGRILRPNGMDMR